MKPIIVHRICKAMDDSSVDVLVKEVKKKSFSEDKVSAIRLIDATQASQIRVIFQASLAMSLDTNEQMTRSTN
jgi:hypothetical protein